MSVWRERGRVVTSLREVLYWDSFSHAYTIMWRRGEQVMGRNGTYQQICAETGGNELALYVDCLSDPVCVIVVVHSNVVNC